MKINEVFTVDEAEEGTVESRKIVQTLRSAGYSQLGSGADSTVWAKPGSGQVLKIIMPESESISKAAYTFKKFVSFCLKHQDIECLPKFIPVGKDYYAEFRLGSKTYIQLFMEQLFPIKRNSFAEGLIWLFSDFVSRDVSWEAVNELLGRTLTWSEYNGRLANRCTEMWVRLSEKGNEELYARYQLLYTVMILLYRTGKINKMYWDLHTENVMQRADGTLVIIDPWFEHEGSAR